MQQRTTLERTKRLLGNGLLTPAERAKKAGVTQVVIEHHMELIMAVADRIAVLNFGQKIAEGRPGLSPRRRQAVLRQELADELVECAAVHLVLGWLVRGGPGRRRAGLRFWRLALCVP